jgi:outer membrane protein assembly factor BamB
MTTDLLYLGTKGRVMAVDPLSGSTVWEATLAGGLTSHRFVTLLVDGPRVYAHTAGQLFCLDARNGHTLWCNELKGFGYDLASLAIRGQASVPTAAAIQDRQTAANAAST